MPVYFLHGFRWPRAQIRIHVILQNLEDVASEWLVAPASTAELLDNFHELFPDVMDKLPGLRFVEQFDPAQIAEGVVCQPHAYIADICHEIKLECDVDGWRNQHAISEDQWGAMLDLRDRLGISGEELKWHVVVCGDEERAVSDDGGEEYEAVEEEEAVEDRALPDVPGQNPQQVSGAAMKHDVGDAQYINESYRYQMPAPVARPQTTESSAESRRSSTAQQQQRKRSFSLRRKSMSSSHEQSNEVRPRGIKRLLGALTRRKSRASMRDHASPALSHSQFDAPPVPPLPRQAV